MSKFTKGELHIEPTDMVGSKTTRWRLADSSGNSICKVWTEANAEELARRWNEYPDLKQQRDDLLAACKFTKAQIKKGAQKKALPILRAAIKKAR